MVTKSPTELKQNLSKSESGTVVVFVKTLPGSA